MDNAKFAEFTPDSSVNPSSFLLRFETGGDPETAEYFEVPLRPYGPGGSRGTSCTITRTNGDRVEIFAIS